MTPAETAVLAIKLEAIDRRADERHAEIKDTLADHGKRLTTVETWRAHMDGAKAALGAWRGGLILLISGATGSGLTLLVNHLIR